MTIKQKNELEAALLKWVTEKTNSHATTEAEIAVLPEIAKLLFERPITPS